MEVSSRQATLAERENLLSPAEKFCITKQKTDVSSSFEDTELKTAKHTFR